MSGILQEGARRWRGGWAGALIRLWRDRRGSISPMLVMGLVPIIGALSMGIEASNWWLTQRTMQNAADSAAIAAAMNGSANDSTQTADCTTVDGWCVEARAVAATYGFTNGSANVVVTPTDGVACPSPLTAKDCFKVVITKEVPVRLLNVVGYQGDTVISGQHYVTVRASAMAYPAGGAAPPFCIVALGNLAKRDLVIDGGGGHKSDLGGCSIASNGATTCNGQPLTNLDFAYGAPGDGTPDCAPVSSDNKTNTAAVTDPYLSQAADIPHQPCASYGTSSSPTVIAPTFTGGGTQFFCGYTAIGTTTSGKKGTTFNCASSATTVNLAAGTILVIQNGTLDICGATLAGTGVTVIFTGSNTGPSNSNFIAGSGTIDISAPTGTWGGATDSWTGFALYQDPDTTHVPAGSITFAGNSPTFSINGLIYTPNADVTISGDVGGPANCMGFMTHTFRINGGAGLILKDGGCDPINLAGEAFLAGRVALVQ